MAKPLKNLKYPMLMIEMLKKGENQSDIAQLLGLSRACVNNRLTGKYGWRIGEVEILCKHYNMDYYELFR